MSTALQTPLLAPRLTRDWKATSVVNDSKNVDARLLKKREADRKCQRKIRERAKARVTALEQVVEELKQKDTSGQVDALLQKLTEKSSEIEALNKKVKSIQAVLSDQTVIEGHATKSSIELDGSESNFVAANNENRAEVSSLPSQGENTDWAVHQPPVTDLSIESEDLKTSLGPSHFVERSHDQFEPRQSLLHSSRSVMMLGNGDPIIPASPRPCDCSEPSPPIGAPRNTWRFANEVLSSRFSWPDYVNDLDDPLVDDIPVRAVVEGWDAVEHHGPVHPSWQILKKIDQSIFWSCNPRERLAVLYTMHMLFDAHSRPEMISDLPEYYRKRPSEDVVHSYAINFFTWPGMRERFIQQQHRYCTNDFWKILTGGIRLLWPYEFRDCYTRNIETGLYTISPLFSERMRDIKVWTVGPEMILRWPEFSVDVPVFNSIPPSLTNHLQSSKLLLANAHRHRQPKNPQRYPGTMGSGMSENSSPQSTASNSVVPKLFDPLTAHNAQTLLWDPGSASHINMIPESSYLDFQNLDHFAMPFT